MKIISVVGYSNTGKTTLIECMIRALKSRGYRVGTIKKIHCGDYEIDKPGKDTYRHKAAGADMVTAYSPHSTDIMIQKSIDIRKVIELYDVDYLFLEGPFHLVYPTIVTAAAYEDIEPFFNDKILFVSGVISESIENYQKYRILNANRDMEHIIKLLENV
ncbi:molybdopterin-guanine dinucleotide biosynthesis protein B [Anaeromicropila populeti]|uniref:Molybdopterin-guanine dinucleotide biosynthesis protein B n=1 Tax=Anaeromicropila populeti TaxID=37658 RepID=A0A1I6HT96_9FIRM|nr:molybdopterin-guanine dinucleotide biosynthesis protein B [Anaeromicropila populeti]SFR57618.1 molybdopterin-guanine dinucleotide biosynthesis protein B [Anaeromicropila populeti]